VSVRVLLICLLALLAAPAAASAQYGYGPDDNPPGANDFSCTPTAAHPEPVVLVHGLGANIAQNWGYMSAPLAADGYCVFALTYGRDHGHPAPFDQPGGLIAMEESSKELAAFVDRVLAATGAAQVDIVGHSEGSLMPNYYVKFMPESRTEEGTSKVDDYVGMTPLWDGSDVGGLGTLRETTGGDFSQGEDLFATGCASCPEFIKGSAFIKKMNEGGTPRVDGITYTMIMTRNDELVIPSTSGEMEGATNIVVQDQCAADPSEHMALAFNPLVLQDIRNALDPAHAVAVDCTSYTAQGRAAAKRKAAKKRAAQRRRARR
jgi:triacylglycerol esterase/lipase EstA (alpha/beta hydrolase family)